MALRAGYYGVKRAFRDLLEQIIPAGADKDNKLSTEADIKNVFKISGVVSAKNFLENKATTNTSGTMPYTVNSDKSVTIGPGITSSAITLSLSGGWVNKLFVPGTYILSDKAGYRDIYTCIARKKGSSGTVNYSVETTGGDHNFVINYDQYDYFNAFINIKANTTLTEAITFYPMVSFEADTDLTYHPYAKTNQQLTTEAATINTTLESHKTEINAIISAATGAADFAAFKTAMAALTPLTRSVALAEETRSLEIEEPVEEEPVTKKRTIKKSTKTEEV